MGCFGSASSKQADSNSSDDSKSQKRRSDAITKQLQKDKQVWKLGGFFEGGERLQISPCGDSSTCAEMLKLLIGFRGSEVQLN
jgi:hypothetical protein